MKNTIVKGVLKVVLAVFGICFYQSAASGDVFGDFTFIEENGGITITDFDTTVRGGVAVPQTINGKSVLVIGSKAFRGSGVTDILLREGIVRIETDAFEFSTVERINIPASVTEIDPTAFVICHHLESIDVAAGNQNYSSVEGVLYNKSVTEIVTFPRYQGNKEFYAIPQGIVRLDISIFNDMRELFTLTVPASITVIDGFNTYEIRYLGSIQVDETNSNYSSLDGVLFTKDKTALLLWPRKKEYNGAAFPESTTIIGELAFYGCYFAEQIILPENLSFMGPRAFRWGRNLKTITIPPLVTALEEETFSECLDLVEVNFNPGLLSIGKKAFYLCRNLYEVFLPENLTHVYEHAFDSCFDLSLVTAYSGLLYIGDYSFRHCDFEEVLIPETVNHIGANPFLRCPLRKITVEPGNPNFVSSDNILYSKNYEEVILYAGYQSSIELKIREGVRVIKEAAFEEKGLSRLLLPDSLNTIERNAFRYCAGYSELIIPEHVETVGSEAFSGISGLKSLIINARSVSLGDGAFFECEQLESVKVNGSISTIDDHCFSECSELRSMNFPEGLTLIGNYAFYLTSLELVTVPGSVQKIGDFAFAGCYWLRELSLNEGLLFIGEQSFSACRTFPELTIPGSVKSIGNQAFAFCSGIRFLTLAEGVEEIREQAFMDCSSLTQLTMPTTLSQFSDSSFQGCYRLDRIYFLGVAPELLLSGLEDLNTDFTVYFFEGAGGFTAPDWHEYQSQSIAYGGESMDWLLSNHLPHDIVLETPSETTGIPLFAYYALNLPPGEPRLMGDLAPENGILDIVFYGGRQEVVYGLEISKDLVNWTSDGVVLTEPDGEGYRTASLHLIDGRCFVRFRILQI